MVTTQLQTNKHLYKTDMSVTTKMQTINIYTRYTCLWRHKYKQQTSEQDTHFCGHTVLQTTNIYDRTHIFVATQCYKQQIFTTGHTFLWPHSVTNNKHLRQDTRLYVCTNTTTKQQTFTRDTHFRKKSYTQNDKHWYIKGHTSLWRHNFKLRNIYTRRTCLRRHRSKPTVHICLRRHHCKQ